MKKALSALICLVLSLCIVFAVTGCGKKPETTPTTENNEPISEEVSEDVIGDMDNTEEFIPEEETHVKPEGKLTIAESMKARFIEEAKKGADLNALAEAVKSVDEVKDVMLMANPYEGDYFDGFSQPVTGYSAAVTVRPVIGSIPLMVYVFETEDAKAFVEANEANMDARWLICVAADETVMAAEGNYVLAVLAPYVIEA